MTSSLPDLEQLLAVAAYLVVRHGDAYAPTFERMEREVETERLRTGNRDRARAVLATMMKRGIKDVAAV